MKTNVNLYVLGLCVVSEQNFDGDGIYSVVSVDSSKASSLPQHQTYLGISGATIESTGKVPPFENTVKYPSKSKILPKKIPQAMRFSAIPLEMTIDFGTPTAEAKQPPTPWPSYDPATYSDLGLGGLKKSIGTNGWKNGEASRFNLPRINTPGNSTAAGWTELLHYYSFPGAENSSRRAQRAVADLFYWRAGYADNCVIKFSWKNGDMGSATVTGDNAQIRIINFAPNEKPASAYPFGYSSAFGLLAMTPIKFKKPKPADQGPQHPKSGGCPPVQGSLAIPKFDADGTLN